MSRPLSDRIPFAKFVVIFAVSFGIGLGLCGMGFFLTAHGVGRGDEEFGIGPISLVSLVILIVSLVGLVVSLLGWAVVGIFVRRDNEIQTLFENSAEEKRDEGQDS